MGDSKKKIYFCGSIRAGCQDRELYLRIIKQLKAYGKVLTEFAFENVKSPDQDGEGISPFTGKPKCDKDIHDLDVTWLEECDVVVAEVSRPSLGVGYEIGRAVAMNKRILCLYRPGSETRLSAMIKGAHNDKMFTVKDYKEEDVPEILKELFDNL